MRVSPRRRKSRQRSRRKKERLLNRRRMRRVSNTSASSSLLQSVKIRAEWKKNGQDWQLAIDPTFKILVESLFQIKILILL